MMTWSWMRNLVLLGYVAGCVPSETLSIDGEEAVEQGEAQVRRSFWLGERHLRRAGMPLAEDQVLAGADLDVCLQSSPRGAMQSVQLFWKTGAQATVRSAPMAIEREDAGPYRNNAQWCATLPSAELGPNVELAYWIRAEGKDGTVQWDSKSGANHRVMPRTELSLFDGTSTRGWRMSGLGTFEVDDGALVGIPGGGLGLVWNQVPTPADFVLQLEWALSNENDNSGVFVRFPNPEGRGYDNAAWYAVHHGYEVQIDERARPDGAELHRTGAVYEQPGQVRLPFVPRPVGTWNQQEIEVRGQRYTIRINGQLVTDFLAPNDTQRGAPGTATEPRFIGLQLHTGSVRFRNLTLKALPPELQSQTPADRPTATLPLAQLSPLTAPQATTFLTQLRSMQPTNIQDGWYLSPIMRVYGQLDSTGGLSLQARFCDRLVGEVMRGFDRSERLIALLPRNTQGGVSWEVVRPVWKGRQPAHLVDASYAMDVYEWTLANVDQQAVRQHGIAFGAELNVGTFWAQHPGDNWRLTTAP
jgi:hypothetical protein